jgi:alkylation response protein AidB-like acyl-CoA dehydrogenase
VHERLTAVIADVIAPAAAEVDRIGTFPRAGVDALAQAGVLGAASATEVGGGGGGIADVAAIVEQIAGGSTPARAGSRPRARPTATSGRAGPWKPTGR